MNLLAIALLVALLLDRGLRIAADLLNVRGLDPEVPREFEGVVDAERYARSQEYARCQTALGIRRGLWDLAVLIAFWLVLDGFEVLDGIVRGMELGPVGSGLVFLGALQVGRMLLDLPWEWHFTFGIEEQFGFNRTTPRTFWLDRLKGLLLAAALGGPLLAGVLWLLESAGPQAWALGWLATVAFTLLVQLVAPAWIMPLFLRFEPLTPGPARDAVLSYGERVGFPLADVFLVDGSRRSSKANAFFTGFGRNRRVALFDTLVEAHDVDEIVGVVAHEVGHYRRGHIWRGMVFGAVQSGAWFALLGLLLDTPAATGALQLQEHSAYGAIAALALLAAPLGLPLGALANALSRRHEREADAFAAETTGAPESLARALMRMSADSLSNLTPHPLYVALHHGHPPVRARVAALRAGSG